MAAKVTIIHHEWKSSHLRHCPLRHTYGDVEDILKIIEKAIKNVANLIIRIHALYYIYMYTHVYYMCI